MNHNWLLSLLLTLSLVSLPAFGNPASKESVKELMERTGAGELGVQIMGQMIPVLKGMIPDAPEEFWENIMAEIDADQIVELVIPVYQKYLNEQDIQEISAFYNTSAGQKLIRVQPAIMQESMAIGQQWGEGLARDVINKYKSKSEQQP